MLFRLVPWKAVWADGSLQLLCFGLRYLVIVLANALLALAWLVLSIVCLFNNLLRVAIEVPPELSSPRTASPKHAHHERPTRRRVKRHPPFVRTSALSKSPGKDVLRLRSPSITKHVSFPSSGDVQPHVGISQSLASTPVRQMIGDENPLAESPELELAENDAMSKSSSASPDSLPPLPLPPTEADVMSSRSVSPEGPSLGEHRMSRVLCPVRVSHRRRTTSEAKKKVHARRRTDPYQAPYFFPTPLSPEADDYVRTVRAERAGFSLAAPPSRQPSQTRPDSPLSSPPGSEGLELVMSAPEPMTTPLSDLQGQATQNDNVPRDDVALARPTREREASSPPPREKRKHHLQLLRALSHSDKRASTSSWERESQSEDGHTSGEVSRTKRRPEGSSRLRRILSRSQDEDTLKQAIRFDPLADVREQSTKQTHRHSWHAILHPHRTSSLNSQPSSLAHEPNAPQRMPANEVSSKSKRRPP
ncbi:unnamed protein product [Somion occarium]|uniref:Uncharacterized protein n=1 Tax=Somion occarium TaxID=3059160 RepID=A0ABP1CEW5_9APHY